MHAQKWKKKCVKTQDTEKNKQQQHSETNYPHTKKIKSIVNISKL